MEPIEEKLEDEIFDVSLLKRKKKKKKTFDLDAVLGGVTNDDINNSKDDDLSEDKTHESIAIEDDTIDLEHFGKKKKKKKPKVNSEINSIQTSTNVTRGPGPGAGVDTDEPDDDINDLNVDFSKVKKKKKTKKSLDELCVQDSQETIFGVNSEQNINSDDNDDDNSDDETNKCIGGKESWLGTDRDYTYDELLRRVYNIIIEKNPEMAGGRKPKFVMRPPQVLRIGSKKTSFANFMDIAKTLHRKPKHLLDFLLAELGTSGSMDGNQQLIIKGRFQAKQIENVLRRYIKEYVTCHTCRSPETILQKDTRLFFLQCESCGSRCSVASIKSGFQAVTSKRAAIRAKTT